MTVSTVRIEEAEGRVSCRKLFGTWTGTVRPCARSGERPEHWCSGHLATRFDNESESREMVFLIFSKGRKMGRDL